MVAKRTCFVISPIGEVGSPTRIRANKIYKYVISEALGQDWAIERADLISEPGIITNQIIDRLVNSDLVIADLSERNPNVFYELAVRHISKKPYVHIIAHDEDIPFDNAPVRAIKIDIADLDSVDEAKKELSAQVLNSLDAESEAESPISIALSLSEFKKTGGQEGAIIQSVLGEMGSLRRQQSDLRDTLSRLIETMKINAAYGNAASALGGFTSSAANNALLNARNVEYPANIAVTDTANSASALTSRSIMDEAIANALAGTRSSSKKRGG